MNKQGGQVGLQVAMFLGALTLLGCPQPNPDDDTTGAACEQNNDCTGGELCVNEHCRAACYSNSDCLASESCVNGGCVVTTRECNESSDCRGPDRCETVNGAYCEGGTCHYAAFNCTQAEPANLCRELSGVCDPTQASGTCREQSCCVFAPLSASASTTASPACPLTGDDANANGVQDGSESWVGTCDADGDCRGCSEASQCRDSNPCSADVCQDQRCVHSMTALLGAACTLTTANDGRCVADGASAKCRLVAGQSCTQNSECADGFCTCANDDCSARVCRVALCDVCQHVSATGTDCVAASADAKGESCASSQQSCNGFGQCVSAAGVACTADADCGSGNCECLDAACQARACGPSKCYCGFDQQSDGTCDGLLSDGVVDPESCAVGCRSGACTKADGVACTQGNECHSRNCVDGVCCNTPCGGNCDQCALPGSVGVCTLQPEVCTGNCGTCSSTTGSCAAAPSACTGNCSGGCVATSGSSTDFHCIASTSSYVCGTCGDCVASGTAFNCVRDLTGCSGNCSYCGDGYNGRFDCKGSLVPYCPSGCTACNSVDNPAYPTVFVCQGCP